MKMKKLIPAILALTLALSVCACSLAEGSTVTLAELKAQAPDRLQMTVTTDAGNTVTVDAPVILPDTDYLPALVCRSQLFDMSKVDDIYPIEKGTGTYEYFHDPNASAQDRVLSCAQESKSYLLRGKTDATERYALPMGSTPPENEFSLEDAMTFILENNVIFGGDPDVDLRVEHTAAMSGLCKTMSAKVTDESTGVSVRGIMANPKKPVKGKERGLWEIETAQYLHGARILGGRSERFIDIKKQGAFPLQPTRSSSMIMDRENFRIAIQYLQEEQELAAEMPLASWSTVENSIRGLIQQDKLKSVCQVELAYVVMGTKADFDLLAQGKMPWQQSGKWQEQMEWQKQMEYVLIPGWEIKGYALNDRNAKYFAASTSPEREAILMNGLGNKWFQDDYTLLLRGENAAPLTGQDLIFDLEGVAK